MKYTKDNKLIGQKILNYKIFEKLDEGGMGIVYKAEDAKLKCTVAIKFLPRQIAVNIEERERCKIEGQAAKAFPQRAMLRNCFFSVLTYLCFGCILTGDGQIAEPVICGTFGGN